ncbi:MAG: MaoC/PaaZ C-terminal domain-containing protein [Ilumatobacteraceae bacterium]
MAINPGAVGATSDPIDISWTSTDALLYAVSLGAGADELAFSTENSEGITQQVLPTFPVVMGFRVPEGQSVMDEIGEFDRTMLVHGSQSVTLHRALPTDGTLTMVSTITDMFDKVKAAVVINETTATMDGQPLYTTRSAGFIRGEGGWGGARGPSGPQNEPPERAPDHELTYQTSPDQAFLYRLNGDRNPLHSDPKFAAAGGFPAPILHGLCTYGFTGRALLHLLCGSDPARFHHIEGRFASPVLPGEALTIRAWELGDGEAVWTTSVGDRLVIDQGLLRYR